MFSKNKILLTGSALLLTGFTAFGSGANDADVKDESGKFSVGMQIRPRFEYRHGFKKPLADATKAASFVEQRSRLWFNYKTSKFRLHLNLQDVRMWGNTGQIYKTDGSLSNIYEGYGEYNFNNKLSMKLGRQALNYDNARFFGNLNWAQQGRSHDAFLLRYVDTTYKLKVHAGFGYNQSQTEPSFLSKKAYSQNNYKEMYFLWINKQFGKFNTSLLFHNDGREKSTDLLTANRQTYAIIPSYKTSKWSAGGEFYLQLGQNAASQEVSAYFAALNFTYKTKITPITIGADMASGTAYDEATTDDNSWNPLYGTNHKFYGFMDYFYVGNAHQQNGRSTGLIDVYGKTNFKFGKDKKHGFGVHVHYFMSPVKLVNPNNAKDITAANANLGTEIDINYSYKFTKGVSGVVGYSQMFAADAMKLVKANSDITGLNNWVWAQINFKTTLFTSKK